MQGPFDSGLGPIIGSIRPLKIDRGSIRRIFWLVCAALAVLLGFHLWELSLTAQWYASMNATPLFWIEEGAPWLVFGLAATAMLPGSWLAADALLARTGLIPAERRIPTWLVAGGATFIFALASTELAPTAVLFWHAHAMGVQDPIFGRDVSFYALVLPFYQGLLAESFFLIVPWALLGTLRARRPYEGIRWLGLIGLWETVHLYLERYQVLYSHQGVVQGASYTDLHANLPLLGADVIVVAAASLALLVFGPRLFAAAPSNPRTIGRRRMPGITWIVAPLAIATLVSQGYPALIQATVVSPNELARELPYLARSIQYTRLAYGLSNLRMVPYSGTKTITASSLSHDPATVNNIRLADTSAVSPAVSQQQAFQPYYDFSPLRPDRYMLHGHLTEVMVAGRMLNTANVPQAAQTWAGRTLLYTHGYGVVMVNVAQFTSSGAPQYLENQMPVRGVVPLSRPQIYFGPSDLPSVAVPSALPEFDYPDVSGVEHDTHFSGAPAGAVPLTFMNRLRLALAGPSLTWFTSGYLNSHSYWLTDRGVGTRLETLYPQILWGRPRFVVSGGGLYLMTNGYTTTSAYPDSAPYEGINYLRQDVVSVVNAYTGRTRLYFYHPDGLLQTYISLDPDLWQPLRDLSAGLVSHMEYGNLGITVQASILSTFHVVQPRAFYLREAVWQVARQVFQDSQPVPIAPYHVIMRDPTDGTGFYLILPFTPLTRTNLAGWLSASENPSDFGRLTMYVIPAEQTVTGPLQAESLVNQNPKIAEQLNLLDQGGSQVLRGNLLTYPIGGSVLYVEPEYVQSQGNPFPQLKEVALVNGTTAVMEPTLRQALSALVGNGPSAPTGPARHPVTGTLAKARAQIATLARELRQLANQVAGLEKDLVPTSKNG